MEFEKLGLDDIGESLSAQERTIFNLVNSRRDFGRAVLLRKVLTRRELDRFGVSEGYLDYMADKIYDMILMIADLERRRIALVFESKRFVPRSPKRVDKSGVSRCHNSMKRSA